MAPSVADHALADTYQAADRNSDIGRRRHLAGKNGAAIVSIDATS
jgi:hypothetical protein